MSVVNPRMTRGMKDAADYFQNLESTVNETGTDVKDRRLGTMLQRAAYAASVFSKSNPMRDEILTELRNGGYIGPEAVNIGMSSNIVTAMCDKYARGKADFGRYDVENAKRVCRDLATYIQIKKK
jgi:hypothetical protein